MPAGQIRIIGGTLRGRKISVPEADVRPTPDRVRETVFNWLAPVIHGAHCLDVFAGSGALGFEALSRGAEFVTFVDSAPQHVAAIEAQLKKFSLENANVYCANAPRGLKKPSRPFDIVFIDPPFQKELLLPTCFSLEEQHFFAAHALIYLEAPHILQQNVLPHTWQLLKMKKAGQVAYHLAKRLV